MFEIYFKDEVVRYCRNNSLTDQLWKEISVQYGRRNRFYHNLLHLDTIVDLLIPVKSEISNWRLLIYSIAYHDIVYDVVRKDNEERSAELAYQRLSSLGMLEAEKEKCRLHILATKGHNINVDEDTNYFTDADLAVLGFDTPAYSKYCAQIRKEYSLFPDFLYNPGRRKVLKHFLSMKSIFKTEYFRKKFELRARENMEREFAIL